MHDIVDKQECNNFNVPITMLKGDGLFAIDYFYTKCKDISMDFSCGQKSAV